MMLEGNLPAFEVDTLQIRSVVVFHFAVSQTKDYLVLVSVPFHCIGTSLSRSTNRHDEQQR